MNYPLGEAILGFAGGPALDMAVVRGHHKYAATCGGWTARRSRTRVRELAAAYDPRWWRPAEPARLARRAADADGPGR